ncbi:MAG: YfhO family protein [Oscillospiraceae bacterium]|nr:YfhO family protein [Oscillospiraceae bacterium]
MENSTAEKASASRIPTAQTKKASASGSGVTDWLFRSRYYLMAFFIPVILMYICYAIFGLYPFGEQSVLALDFNAQYVYYFEALRDAFWGDGSIFYNWSRNLSGGYMGVIGYYLASPFTLIVMLLPEKMMLTSLLIMILAKIGSASLTFHIYLQKSKKLQPLPALIFGILYSLMAYMVIQTIDPMWLDGLVFLPLIALGVEYLVDDGRKINYIIPIAVMFVANFYIGYMIGIFTAIYFIYYFFFGTEQKNRKFRDMFYTCMTFGVSTLVAVMCAAFMILPVYKALSLGKFDFTDPDYSFQTQFDPIIIFRQLLTCQYDSVNVQGSPEIYCGILTVVLVPLYFLNRKITLKHKLGYGFLLLVMFFSMYIKPVDMWWHGGQVPNWLPFRYSFIVSFILLSMAATAFRELEHIEANHLGGVFFGFLALCLFINSQNYESMDEMKSIWLSVGLSAVYLLILYGILNKKNSMVLPIVLLCAISGELVFNTVETMHAVDKEVAYSSRASYRTFIQSGRAAVDLMEEYDKNHSNGIDGGLYRSEKTYVRCVNDNMAFGLKGLTHSSSVMNAQTLNFIETMGYNMRSYYSRYDGTTELADSLLGIKYVLDRGDSSPRNLLHPSYIKVDEYNFDDYDDKDADGNPKNKTISIYQNPNALSMGYLVSDDLLRIDHLGNDNPFNSQNVLLSTMMGETQFDEAGQIASVTEYYTPVPYVETVLGAVTLSDYNGQATYTKMDSGDPTIDYRFTVTENKRIYAYLKTENEQAVNLWLGTWDNVTENYNFTSFGRYFETKNYCILDLGVYEVGTQVALRVTVDNDQNATIIKAPYFYYFNEDVYQEDIDVLKTQQMQIQKATATYLRGTVTSQEGQILFTSIPYEDGWTVKVDGRKVQVTNDDGSTETVNAQQCLKAMIYVPLDTGTHTITMSYTPPYFVLGVIMLGVGVAIIIMFWQYDRKNNKVLIAKFRNKKRAAMQAEKAAS